MLRLPNLPTVIGDPIVGFAFALAAVRETTFHSDRVDVPVLHGLAAVGAGLLLYMYGLVSNDLFDLPEDRRERPGRPLPSGAVAPKSAWILSLVLLLGGLVSAWYAGRPEDGLVVYTAGGLAFLIYVYNRFAKRIFLIGPLVMGLCRGLNVMLGALVFGWLGGAMTAVVLVAGFWTAYVAAVTHLAGRETERRDLGRQRNLPVFVVTLGLAIFFIGAINAMDRSWDVYGYLLGFCILAVLTVAWISYWTLKLGGVPEPKTVQRSIGGFIQGLILLQAAMISLLGPTGLYVAAGLLCLLPVSILLARRFYAS
ncbi:MAG: UbiA family prenyltransferase [Phycisphaerae bacterium]